MSSQKENVDFLEIIRLPDCEIKHMPTNMFFKSCISALDRKICDKNIVFKYGLDFISECRVLLDLEEKMLENFLSSLVEYIVKDVLEEILICFEEGTLCSLINLMTYLHSMLWRVKDFTDLELSKIGKLLDYSLQALQECYSFYKQSSNSQETLDELLIGMLDKILVVCGSIQRLVITIIADNLGLLTSKNGTDFEIIVKVFTSLCNVGEYIGILDVKSTAEIWKCISKLCSDNADFLKLNVNTESDPFNMKKPIKFLCNEINSCVSTIYQNDGQYAGEKLERILKINSFYLKILIKFATDLGCENLSGFDNIIEMHLTVISYPITLKDTAISQLVHQYLTVGIVNLITIIYRHKEFAKELFNKPLKNTSEFENFLIISNEIMKDIVSNDKQEEILQIYFDGDPKFNILQNIFDKILKCNNALTSRNIYENLVINIAAFIISISSSNRITICEQVLAHGILQNDYMLGLVCLDVWMTLARFANSDTRYRFFQFWCDYNEFTPIISSEPKDYYVRVLLGALYDFLPTNKKQKITHDIQHDKINSKLHLVLDSKRMINDNTNIDKPLSSLYSNFKKFLTSPTKDAYYSLVFRFNTFQTNDGGDNLFDVFKYTVSIICENIQNYKFHALLCSFITSLYKNISIMPYEALVTILDKLSKITSKLTNSTTKLYLIKLYSILSNLNFCSNDHIAELVSHSINSVEINSTVLRSYLLLYSNKYVIQNTSRINFKLSEDNNNKYLLDKYFRIPRQINYKHLCKLEISQQDICEVPPKKCKINNENEILKQMICDTKKICELFKHVVPNEDEIKQIKEILKDLQTVIKQTENL